VPRRRCDWRPRACTTARGPGRVLAADEGAAGGSGGLDRDGAQVGTDRLPAAEARDDVRASESARVRGADEGEAGQGVEAEGTPVGAGGGREDADQRCNGSRSTGARVEEDKRASAVGQEAEGTTGKGEEEQPVGPIRGCGRRECAPRRIRENDRLGALGKLSGEVPCNRRATESLSAARHSVGLPGRVPERPAA
jgi:hypothetical protein